MFGGAYTEVKPLVCRQPFLLQPLPKEIPFIFQSIDGHGKTVSTMIQIFTRRPPTTKNPKTLNPT